MELFRLLGRIAIDNSTANKAIDETTDKAAKSEGKLSKSFEKMGSFALKAGKVIATGLAVGVTAIAGLTTAALNSYADYEQLVGGVETLFKESGQKVQEYADEAYKTAGMSANEYMETVTSFSASLIQSLGGDTKQAAEKANQAIIDMSDNANKMGSSMESIQNAYQGFAKQNYTMLDNLKLGYGGTKEEMARLLADAQAISGIEYDISSYADVVDAIHVIQEEMGIAGTTAKEASSTISGSISSMKSAWQNLLTGLGNENADLSALINQFADSVVTVAGNVIPRIKVILPRIGQAIIQSVPVLMSKISTAISESLPAIAETLTTGLSSAIEQSGFSDLFSDDFKEYFAEVASGWGAMAERMKDSIFSTFSENFTKIQDAIQVLQPVVHQLAENYLKSLIDRFNNFMAVCETVVIPIFNLVVSNFVSLATTIATSVAPVIANISNKFMELQQFVSAAIQNYILPAISAFITMMQELWAENQDKIALIGELFRTGFQAIADIVSWFVEIFKNYIYPLFAWFSETVISNMDNIKGIFQAAFDILGGIVSFFIALFQGDWAGMWEAVKSILSGGKDFIVNVFNLIKGFLSSIGTGIATVVQNAFEKVRSSIENKLTLAKEKVSEIFTAIKDSIFKKMEDAKDIVSKAVQKLKDFFDFDWSLPKIKLPHFSISGSFSLNPPKAPSFGIEWYKNGGVMMKPTAFGINPANGKMMVGGEAGAEAIAPIAVLQKYIQEAVGANDMQIVEAINEGFNQLINLLLQYIPQLSNMQLVMDTGVVVGELAPQMDVELGKLAIKNKRGV